MNCFYHLGVSAVGSCKSCGKGLCPACAADLGKGLACRNRCEPDVAAVIDLLARNIRNAPVYDRILRSNRRAQYFGASFLLILGCGFIAFQAYEFSRRGLEPSDLFPLILGAIFIIFGILNILRIRKLPVLPKDSAKK
jgi:hypothetical protein